MSIKVAVIIPARFASSRFPGKVLTPFFGLPMIEHVRRRAAMSRSLSEVVVATCDQNVAEVVKSYGGRVVMTSDQHPCGTDRVVEALKSVDCTHVISIQGDEPLILPYQIDEAVELIRQNPEVPAWNAIADLDSVEDLDNRSIVKCVVSQKDRFLFCFRKSPFTAPLEKQMPLVKKVLGFIVYRKDWVGTFSKTPQSSIEKIESMEQIRMVEAEMDLRVIWFKESYPGVNYPEEAKLVEDSLQNNPTQIELLKKTLSWS